MIERERLERYQAFVAKNSADGSYDPRKGLESILSVLTPESKAIVFASMGPGEVFFDGDDVRISLDRWLEHLGLGPEHVKLTARPLLTYCKRLDGKGDGALTSRGFVEAVSIDEKTGYRSTPARELVMPLILSAADFVYNARNSKIKHRYDSMWRLLGSINSNNGVRRQLVVYDVVKYLMDHPDRFSTCFEMADAFDANPRVVSLTLNSMNRAGLIGYRSEPKEVKGKSQSGWMKYELSDRSRDFEEIYGAIKRSRPTFTNRSATMKALEYFRNQPDVEYDNAALNRRFGMGLLCASSILSLLSEVGVLTRLHGAKPNGLTKMFYETVLNPAQQAASTLEPMQSGELDPEKIAALLDNYQEERSHTSIGAGDETKAAILKMLKPKRKMKLSHIVDACNELLGRDVGSASYSGYLRQLRAERLVKKIDKGHYVRLD